LLLFSFSLLTRLEQNCCKIITFFFNSLCTVKELQLHPVNKLTSRTLICIVSSCVHIFHSFFAMTEQAAVECAMYRKYSCYVNLSFCSAINCFVSYSSNITDFKLKFHEGFFRWFWYKIYKIWFFQKKKKQSTLFHSSYVVWKLSGIYMSMCCLASIMIANENIKKINQISIFDRYKRCFNIETVIIFLLFFFFSSSHHLSQLTKRQLQWVILRACSRNDVLSLHDSTSNPLSTINFLFSVVESC
jgi:hypothetical protein